MKNPRRVRVRGTYRGRSPSVNPKFVILQTQRMVNKLPRHPGRQTGFSDSMPRERLGVIVVEVVSIAGAYALRFCIAASEAPGKRPVELPQYPRPPPGFESLRAQKEPASGQDSTG